jgi:hypothetical protein
MKLLRSLFLLLVTPGLVWAQSSTQVADASQNNPDVAAELKALREALLQTQKQMASQQREIEALRDQVKTRQASQAGSEQAPRVIDAAMNTAIPSDAIPAGNVLGANAGQQSMPLDKGQAQESTPTFRIGSADIRLGGLWTLRIYIAPPTPRTISPPTTRRSHIATRPRAIFPSIVSPHSFPVST